VGDGVKPPLGDRLATFYTDAKSSSLNPVQRRLDGEELLLSGLAEFFQDFIVISLGGTIVIIRITRLLEIMLDRSQAGFQLMPAFVKDRLVLFDMLPRLRGGLLLHGRSPVGFIFVTDTLFCCQSRPLIEENERFPPPQANLGVSWVRCIDPDQDQLSV
jgi:hypothetical protein